MISAADKKSSENRVLPPGFALAKLIAVLSLVLPLLFFLGASWVSYNAHIKDMREHLEAQADLARQHARRVFAIFDLTASQVEEALLQYDDRAIVEKNAELSAKLDRLSGALPEVDEIWVLNDEGKPIVTSVITPAPLDIDFSKQDFFVAQREGAGGTFISERIPGYFRPSQFFKLSYRRQTADHQFRGAVVLTGDPRSFEPFYAGMLGDGLSTVALMRMDGAILARVPASQTVSRVPADTAFMRTVSRSPDRGWLQDVSPVDGKEKLLVYRSVTPLPAFIVVAIDMENVRRQWMQSMVHHLYFGLPATFALFIISLAAIRQARRQAETLGDLQREAQRRAFAEEALRQANKMEAIGRLTGGVAHDFNNLLQVMLGRLARINKSAERREAPTLRDIDAMQFAIDRAANLTHRLLAFSRQQPLRMDVVDVNHLISGMTELIRQTAGNEIVVENVYATGVWPVSIDPNQLENAILNLTSNARDAMNGSGRITIRTENLTIAQEGTGTEADLAPGEYVCISFSDTGQGIPSDMIEKVFEPFFTTKPVGQGTGLGLSMVYGFLRQSGGDVRVYSEVGNGTVVRLYLPRVPGEVSERIENGDLSGVDESGSGVVLVVEDEVEVRRLVIDSLRDAGYTVLAAAHARDGLRLLDDNPSVQLLLTDIGLPDGMNGRELAEAAVQRHPQLKVIFMTGYSNNALEPDGNVAPAVALLAKPFNRAALMKHVRDALAQARVSG